MVVMERTDPSTSCSTRTCSCSSVSDMWKRSFRPRMVLDPWKQGRWDPVGGRQEDKCSGESCQVEEACRKRVGTVLHDLHDLQNLLHVLPGCDQTLKHQHLVVDEHVAVWTSHHLQTHNLRQARRARRHRQRTRTRYPRPQTPTSA